MQTVGMLMFYGEEQPTTTTLTEATFFDMIEEGNIYGKLCLLCSSIYKLESSWMELNQAETVSLQLTNQVQNTSLS